MAFSLPNLPYSHDALEPHIDARTMQIHHGKHHNGYTNKLNKALEGQTSLASKSIEDLLRGIDQVPQTVRVAIQNNGGGYANHSLFWTVMSPNGGGDPSGDLAAAIASTFGDASSMKESFSNAAKTRFGSGWAWLVVNKNGGLEVYSTANQDSPYMRGHTPILGLDVWEHAYYLHYQNRRPDYVAAFWNLVNWEQVARNFAGARG